MAGGETRNTHTQVIGSGGSGVDQDQFETFDVCQWTVAGRTIGLAVTSIEEGGENRLVKRERPYRDGAKLDDTGSAAKQWNVHCVFNNTVTETGLDAINGGLPLYPDVLNAVLELFDIHETGDLILPTAGKVRVKAATYQRVEGAELRDTCPLVLVFIEDNEDKVDFRSLQQPSANANARRLASTTEFDAQTAAVWSASLAQVNTLLSDLETIINSPGSVEQDVAETAMRIQGHTNRIRQAFKSQAKDSRNMLRDPSNSRVERKMVRANDLSARAIQQARKGRPQTVVIVFQQWTSLFRVSAIVGQSFDDLLEVNPEVDPFYIPAMTPVNVFATQELLNGSRNTAA